MWLVRLARKNRIGRHCRRLLAVPLSPVVPHRSRHGTGVQNRRAGRLASQAERFPQVRQLVAQRRRRRRRRRRLRRRRVGAGRARLERHQQRPSAVAAPRRRQRAREQIDQRVPGYFHFSQPLGQSVAFGTDGDGPLGRRFGLSAFVLVWLAPRDRLVALFPPTVLDRIAAVRLKVYFIDWNRLPTVTLGPQVRLASFLRWTTRPQRNLSVLSSSEVIRHTALPFQAVGAPNCVTFPFNLFTLFLFRFREVYTNFYVPDAVSVLECY